MARDPDGSGGTLKVNPDELAACGGSAQQIAEQMPGQTAKIVAPSDQATAALHGWKTGAALHDCTSAWKTLLDGLSKDMDGYGAKMIQMAQNYRQADQTAAAGVNAVAQSSVAAGNAPFVPPAGAPDPFGTAIVGRPYEIPPDQDYGLSAKGGRPVQVITAPGAK
jgi:hypothetical protein